MKTVIFVSLSLFSTLGLAYSLPSSQEVNRLASLDPMSVCSKAPTMQIQLECQLNVVNSYLKNEFGDETLVKANKLATQACSQLPSHNFKMDPQLLALAGLQCEVSFKVEYYNKLVEEGNSQQNN